MKKKKKKAPAKRKGKAPSDQCPLCGLKMQEVHDVVGDSWQCYSCGHTEEMRGGPQGGIP